MNKNLDILFRNFEAFQQSEKAAQSLKALVFQLALSGRLDFQKLSNGRIKRPLKALVDEQKARLQKKGVPFDAQMDSVWPMVELGSVGKIVGGGTPSTSNAFYWNGNIHWITPRDLSDYSRMYISKGQKSITAEGLKKSSAKIVPPNTVLLSTRAPIGYVAISKNPLSTNQGFRNIILNKQCVPEYIYYILKSKTKLLNSLGSGAVFKELSGGKLKKLEILLPPLAVQKEIVSLMEKCALLETQTKEKSKTQKELSKSSMHFITQARNKKELAHRWKRLKNNFKDVLYSENGAKEFKSMVFQMALSGRLDFQKLSSGRVKRPLEALVEEQAERLQKEGVPFSMPCSHAGPSLQESPVPAKLQRNIGKAKKKSVDFEEQSGRSVADKMLDFQDIQNLSESHTKASRPLDAFIKEQKRNISKASIIAESDNMWPIVKLGDVSSANSGNSAPQNKQFFQRGKYPFCRTSDVGKVHISNDFTEIHDFLNDEGVKGLRLFKKNTILIPKSGASTFLNHRVILGIDSYVSSHLAAIYANQKMTSPNFIFTLLCFVDTKNLTSEQNYPSLKLSQIKALQIPLPPLEVQKEIVNLMQYIESMEKQIQEEKNLSLQLSQSLSHFARPSLIARQRNI